MNLTCKANASWLCAIRSLPLALGFIILPQGLTNVSTTVVPSEILSLCDTCQVLILGETQPAMTTSADMAPSPSGSIIGNRSSKMYHRPGCPNYAKIAPENRVRFASEEEALAAGYRVAGNCW